WPVVRAGAFSTSVLTLAEGVLFGMSMHKLRLVILAILVLAVLAGAGVWAGRPTASGSAPPPAAPKGAAVPPDKKAEEKKPAAPKQPGKEAKPAEAKPITRDTEIREGLRERIDFGGLDDPKTSLREVLDSLTKKTGITFDINELAFKMEALMDV